MRSTVWRVGRKWLLCSLAVLASCMLGARCPIALGPRLPDAPDCPLMPPDSYWHVSVEDLPVHPRSDSWVESIGASDPVHPDFGAGLWQGGPIGIPYTTAGAETADVPVQFGYEDESDPGPYPIPDDAPIEGGPDATGDRHVLVVDRNACILYELYDAHPEPDGSWSAGSGAIFDLLAYELRPETWTSADAAGLPILPGLVRYEEVAAGHVAHAIRFTAPRTQRGYLWPARHFASSSTDADLPPMGAWFRLKPSVDLADFSPQTRPIVRALQRHGMILADNGSPWFLSGAPDPRWDNDILRELRTLRGTDFEAVDTSSLPTDPDSLQVR
ncbi:MAG: hypothetical protein GY723_09485 [bacterium]|nr:hypothetical protein [bacterium]MCP5067997.1 hypothetical protein [bacterium]